MAVNICCKFFDLDDYSLHVDNLYYKSFGDHLVYFLSFRGISRTGSNKRRTTCRLVYDKWDREFVHIGQKFPSLIDHNLCKQDEEDDVAGFYIAF